MILYDFFVEKILPLFVDLSKFPHGEKIFYYFFVAVLTYCIVVFFIYIPFKLIFNLITKFTNNKKNIGDLW